jgi:hypothetical protein
MKVYKRTSEGQWAAFDEHSPLPRKLKILLKAINGKVAEDVYVQNLGSFGDVRALLSSLEQAGLIADRGQRARTSPAAAAPATPTVPPAAVAVAPAAVPTPEPETAPAPVGSVSQGTRRPSPVLWQTLPELTEVSESTPEVPVVQPPVVAAAPMPTSPVSTLQLAAAAAAAANAPVRRPDLVRAPPVLTEVHVASDASRLAQLDAMAALADLAELAGQSASVMHTSAASNILTHNALLAANDEPVSDAVSQRAAVRHAVELMSNFVLEHMPRTASQVLPEIESLHSVEQWAELMDGYAVFIAPTGERGHNHIAQMRRMLDAAFDVMDVSPKGWYA